LKYGVVVATALEAVAVSGQQVTVVLADTTEEQFL
jgi:hypothetical protein